MSLLVIVAFLTSGYVEAFAGDCDEGCLEYCASVCGCFNCPPPLVTIVMAHSNQVVLPVILSWSALGLNLELEQEWFEGIDRPPRFFR